MHYTKFKIENYRAITGPLVIPISKHQLVPIIGVNESGKTTILHALFSFDMYNDDLNDGGRHLNDVANLYRTTPATAFVSAEVEISNHELKSVISSLEKTGGAQKAAFASMKKRRKLPHRIEIRRNITTKKYTVEGGYFGSVEAQDLLARRLINRLPYILYFDDFRDKIAERIEIPAIEDDSLADWAAIMQQLFKQTDESFSIFDLKTLEVRQRRTVLAKVQRNLNETLTKEWQTFRLDDRDALMISLQFERDGATNRDYLKLEVIERDSNGDDHFFFISDRSKGFYWFFNFVMKLEFNPKVNSSGVSDAHSIYLLDEPGSYLHALAQQKLCVKLKQISEKNTVVYCTHSHYLLDPRVIPPTSIVIADKNGDGDVSLTRMLDYKGDIADTRSALQPVLDALQIKPYALDLLGHKQVLIVEGIYDYFAIELFKGSGSFTILPSVGADSIKFYISLMIAWRVKFCALWDNDTEGRKKRDQAAEFFGEHFAANNFRLLPAVKDGGKRIMQDLFSGTDLQMIRKHLALNNDCSYERVLHALFYSKERDNVMAHISDATRENFSNLFESLNLDIN